MTSLDEAKVKITTWDFFRELDYEQGLWTDIAPYGLRSEWAYKGKVAQSLHLCDALLPNFVCVKPRDTDGANILWRILHD